MNETTQSPRVAVIFISKLRQPADAYAETLARMKELGTQQPGFLGIEGVRAPDGRGITVVFYESAEAARAWGRHPEHLEIQRRGREEWYEHYQLYYAEVVEQRSWARALSALPLVPGS